MSVLRRVLLTLAVLLFSYPLAQHISHHYWLQVGRNADTPQAALDAYAKAGDAVTAEDTFVAYQALATHPADRYIYTLAEAEQHHWDVARQQELVTWWASQGQAQATRLIVDTQVEWSVADLELLWEVAQVDLQRQDWTSAHIHLQKLLAANPRHVGANYQMGLLLAFEAPATAQPYLEVAIANRDYTNAAQQVLQTLLSSTTFDAGTRYRTLGATFVTLQEWRHAERPFSAALELDNLDWFSYAYRGYVRDQLGKYETAEEDLETAVALAPATALPYYFTGLHWRDNPRPDFGLAHNAFTNAYYLEQDNPALAIEIARTFQMEKQYERAREWYDIGVGLDPLNPEWLKIRAAFYADTAYSVDESAMLALEDAYRYAPDDPDVMTSLGRGYFLAERYDEAKSLLEKAVNLAPNNPRTLFYYATLMHKVGEDDAARLAYSTVIQLEGEQNGYGVLAVRLLAQLDD